MADLPSIARNLQWNAAGFWDCPAPGGGLSYPAGGNQACFAVEDGSFWFEHRNACILAAIEALAPRTPLIDIGGGNGFVAKALQDAGIDVALLEPGPDGVRNALGRGVRQVVRGAIETADFLPGGIPSAGMFDVLEHIEEDAGFLKLVYSLLQPGGRLYLTVPAGRGLWSGEDEHAGHYRRYSVGGLRALLEAAGFTVEFATPFFGFLVLPILLLRTLPSRLGLAPSGGVQPRAHHVTAPAVKRPLDWLAGRELRRISAGREMRAGSSCLAVAKK
jgi:SAM-dependent methyltransferase